MRKILMAHLHGKEIRYLILLIYLQEVSLLTQPSTSHEQKTGDFLDRPHDPRCRRRR